MTGISMKVLGAAAVESLLSVGACVKVVAEAMRAVTRQQVLSPLRTVMPLAPPNAMGIMPGAMLSHGRFGIKVIALYPGNGALGLPSHAGVTVLFDAAQGTPLAVLDSNSVTALRTAAASAVATGALARQDSQVVALLGTGHQALWHVHALRSVMKIRRLQVWSRTAASVAHFVAQLGALDGVEVVVANSAQASVAGADVVCTVSSSREPILQGAWLVAGQHVNLVGASVASAREADTEVVRRSRFFVDTRASAAVQAGEWLQALQDGVVEPAHLRGEIGEVLLGQVPGRESAADITVYKSLGHVAQDIATAEAVYQKALERAAEFPDLAW
jgi:ornithine cyclodeaminase/alanine dehydrogenase-like protein (mu-crystallin family)